MVVLLVCGQRRKTSRTKITEKLIMNEIKNFWENRKLYQLVCDQKTRKVYLKARSCAVVLLVCECKLTEAVQ